MLKDIKIGCASSKTKYGTRLDTSIVKLEKEAIWSGLFTSNKFKSAPVEICLKKINFQQKAPRQFTTKVERILRPFRRINAYVIEALGQADRFHCKNQT